MSDGTPKPATWPICRGPFAYGQATATRIFLDFVASLTVANDKECSRNAPPPGQRRSRPETEQQEHREEQTLTDSPAPGPDEAPGASSARSPADPAVTTGA